MYLMRASIIVHFVFGFFMFSPKYILKTEKDFIKLDLGISTEFWEGSAIKIYTIAGIIFICEFIL